MSRTPTLALCIPTYGRDQVLLQTIEGVLKQTRLPDEVIVIDQTLQYPSELRVQIEALVQSGRLRWIEQAEPSLPRARNLALSSTRCEYMVFIDDDVVLPTNFVQAYAAALTNDAPSAIAGAVDQANGWSEVKRPTSWPRVLDYKFFFLGGGQDVRGVANFMGANHCVHVRTAIALGGYDERFIGVALREESDLALRFYAAGHRIDFVSAARLLHLQAPAGGCRRRSPYDVSASCSSILFAYKNLGLLRGAAMSEVFTSMRLAFLNKRCAKNPVTGLVCALLYARFVLTLLATGRQSRVQLTHI